MGAGQAPEPSSGASAGSANADASADHDEADVMFAKMMIPHHTQAVQMSENIVAKKNIDPQVTELLRSLVPLLQRGISHQSAANAIARPVDFRLSDTARAAAEYHARCQSGAAGVVSAEEPAQHFAADVQPFDVGALLVQYSSVGV